MSVDFEPVKIAPKRRVDPAFAGVVAVAFALVVAVIKPWQSHTDPPVPTAAAALALTASPTGPPRPCRTALVAPTRQPIPATPPPAWADLAPVLESHDEWGVQAISVLRRAAVELRPGPDPGPQPPPVNLRVAPH